MTTLEFSEERAWTKLLLARMIVRHAARCIRRAQRRCAPGWRSEVLTLKRRQVLIAAEMAKAIQDSAYVARKFRRLAIEKHCKPARSNARPHIQLLKFLGAHAPGGSLPRHSDQIERLLKTGEPVSRYRRLIERGVRTRRQRGRRRIARR